MHKPMPGVAVAILVTIFVNAATWAASVGTCNGSLDPHAYDLEATWQAYSLAQKQSPTSSILLRALARLPSQIAPRSAIELGVGSGNDIVAMVARGFRVVAIDKFAAPIRVAEANLLERSETRSVRFLQSSFEDMDLQPDSADLINAEFALHLVPPAHFTATWNRLVRALKSGGVFAGTFLGERDGWAGNANMSHQTIDQVRRLFKDFEKVDIREHEYEYFVAGSSEIKHWHIFAVTAVR